MSKNIRGFHAHVYFDAATRPTAEHVHDALAQSFDVKIGQLYDRPVGPHHKPMFQVTLAPSDFATVVPWLMLHRDGLSVLVHPSTEDPVADHETHPFWMGESIPIDLDFIRRAIEQGLIEG